MAVPMGTRLHPCVNSGSLAKKGVERQSDNAALEDADKQRADMGGESVMKGGHHVGLRLVCFRIRQREIRIRGPPAT